MRYRRITYEYVTLTTRLGPWPHEGAHQLVRWTLRPHACWTPPCDVYETRDGLTVTVELAGVDEEQVEILLYLNALVVQGERYLARAPGDSVYHAAEIRQGPFRVEVPLQGPVDYERVEAHMDRGVLYVFLPRAR